MNFCKFSLYKKKFLVYLGTFVQFVYFQFFFSGIKNSTVKLPGNKFQPAESEEGSIVIQGVPYG